MYVKRFSGSEYGEFRTYVEDLKLEDTVIFPKGDYIYVLSDKKGKIDE
jgi:hypothetical protein